MDVGFIIIAESKDKRYEILSMKAVHLYGENVCISNTEDNILS